MSADKENNNMEDDVKNENESAQEEEKPKEEEADADKVEKEEEPDIPPNQTLYVNNLKERVKLQELKDALYAIFSECGEVLEINAGKSLRMRGQAWVVMKDLPSATKALNKLQDFPFMGKEMKIQYAKEKSDIISEMEGKEIDKKARMENKKRKRSELEEKLTKKKKTKGSSSNRRLPKQKNEPPNAILFVENLPELANAEMLSVLFSQYPGFKEVRMIPNRSLAFVEFENEVQSGVALSGLQHFKISQDHVMVISFAKK